MKNRFVLITFILACTVTARAVPPDEGKNIFTTRCAACHNVNRILTGPALAGIDQRRSIEWIINFVHSSQTVIKSGDDYAAALFEKFNKVQMPDHSDLTETNIKNIVDYIKLESKVVVANDAPFGKPGKLKAGYLPLSLQRDYWFFLGYLIAVGLLITALLFAVQIKRIQNNLANNKSSE